MGTKEATEKRSHVTPLFSSADIVQSERQVATTACERPCVCHCVCRHGGSKAIEFMGQSSAPQRELFSEFVASRT